VAGVGALGALSELLSNLTNIRLRRVTFGQFDNRAMYCHREYMSSLKAERLQIRAVEKAGATVARAIALVEKVGNGGVCRVQDATGVTIENNTVLVEGSLPWSISVRFPLTSGVVRNNLTNRQVLARDGFDGLYCYPTLDHPALDAGGHALLAEIDAAAGENRHLDAARRELASVLGRDIPESDARRTVERMALALQASLLVRHSPPAVADAFCASRLGGEWGRSFGTLNSTVDMRAIVERATP